MKTNISGATLIAQERERQITKEGFTPIHDDQWTECQLGDAAIAYLLTNDYDKQKSEEMLLNGWAWFPWDEKYWKPSPSYLKNLVRAGALVAAEIDRVLRLQAKQEGEENVGS